MICTNVNVDEPVMLLGPRDVMRQPNLYDTERDPSLL